jgi:hypothetical protein
MLEGTVVTWIQTDRHASGTIQDSNGDWYRVKGEHVDLDRLGRCELIEGESVFFERGPDGTTKGGKVYRTAIGVKRPFKDDATDYRTHREFCKVLDKNWLLRERGGLLTVNFGDLDGMRSGNIVSCGVQPEPGFRTWRATDIEFAFNSESDLIASDGPVDGPRRPLTDTAPSVISVGSSIRNLSEGERRRRSKERRRREKEELERQRESRIVAAVLTGGPEEDPGNSLLNQWRNRGRRN